MKNLASSIPGIAAILFFLGCCAFLIADGIEHYRLTKGVVWNSDLQELRHKRNEILVDLQMVNRSTVTYGDEARREIKYLTGLEMRYRVSHNRLLAATLARDLWIARDPELLNKAYQVSAL